MKSIKQQQQLLWLLPTLLAFLLLGSFAASVYSFYPPGLQLKPLLIVISITLLLGTLSFAQKTGRV